MTQAVLINEIQIEADNATGTTHDLLRLLAEKTDAKITLIRGETIGDRGRFLIITGEDIQKITDALAGSDFLITGERNIVLLQQEQEETQELSLVELAKTLSEAEINLDTIANTTHAGQPAILMSTTDDGQLNTLLQLATDIAVNSQLRKAAAVAERIYSASPQKPEEVRED